MPTRGTADAPNYRDRPRGRSNRIAWHPHGPIYRLRLAMTGVAAAVAVAWAAFWPWPTIAGRPVVRPPLIFALAPTLFGLVYVLETRSRVVLEIDEDDRIVRVSRRSLLATREIVIALHRIDGAKVSRDGERTRIVLARSEAEDLELLPSVRGERGYHEALASRISAVLARGKEAT